MPLPKSPAGSPRRRSGPPGYLLSTFLLLALLAPLANGPATAQDGEQAELIFAQAERREQEGDLEKALAAYELLVTRFPDSELAPEALLRLAEGRYRLGQVAAARQAAGRLTSGYPQSPSAAGGLLLIADAQARSAVTRSALEEARETLLQVGLLFPRDLYPLLLARSEARVEAGELSILLGEYPQAAASFVAVIEEEPVSRWSPRARLGLAQVLLAEGDWVGAADVLQRLLDAAERGDGAGLDEETAGVVRRRLTLIHRLLLRPATGLASWSSSRLYSPARAELKRPVGIAVDEAGTRAVVDRGERELYVVGADGRILQRIDIHEPGSPSWSGDRLLMPEGDRLLESPSPHASHRYLQFEIPDRDKMERVKGVTACVRGLFGDYFLLESGRDRVVAFGPDQEYRSILTQNDPVDIARSYAGTIYVLDRKARQVSHFAPDGSPLGIFHRGEWRDAQALAVDLVGRVYVLDGNHAQVDVIDPSGSRIATLGPRLPGGVELRNPTDLSVDGSGRLYITDAKLDGVVILE